MHLACVCSAQSRTAAASCSVLATNGGRVESLGFVPSHTELNRDVLLRLGVPAAAIVMVGISARSASDQRAISA